MTLDGPASGGQAARGDAITVQGWALNTGIASGTGVDIVHVYALAAGIGQAAIFLGVATSGVPRPDVGALYQATYRLRLFALDRRVAGARSLHACGLRAQRPQRQLRRGAHRRHHPDSAGQRAVHLHGHTGAYRRWSPPRSRSAAGRSIRRAAGHRRRRRSSSTSCPTAAPAPAFHRQRQLRLARRRRRPPLFGSRFTNSGFHFTVTGLAPGTYLLAVYAHSTVTRRLQRRHDGAVHGQAPTLMSIDAPSRRSDARRDARFGVAGLGHRSHRRGRQAPASTRCTSTPIRTRAAARAPIFLGVAIARRRPFRRRRRLRRALRVGLLADVDRAAAGPGAGRLQHRRLAHSSVSNSFNAPALKVPRRLP